MGGSSVAFYAGFGKRDITPAPGTRFGGFWIERGFPADGVHDPLQAHAMVLGSGPDRAVILSLDLQLVSPVFVAEVRAEVERACGIPGRNVMVGATHDHAAPGGNAAEAYYRDFDDEDIFLPVEARRRVFDGVIGAVDDAVKDVRKGTLLAKSARISGIGKARAEGEGEQLFPVTVLLFKGVDGEPVGVLTNYPCHVSILGTDNRQFSADWVAVLNREVSRHLGAPSMFLQGACAEVSTRRTRREQTFSEVERLGRELVAQVLPLFEQATEVDSEEFFARSQEFRIPLRIAEVSKALETPAAKQALAAPAGSAGNEARRVQFMAERFRRIVETGLESVPAEVQVIRFGHLAFVGVTAEVHTSIADEVLRLSPAGHTLIAAPANGSVGNITPDASAMSLLDPRGVKECSRVILDLLKGV
jgi:hypothetical protein